MMSLVVASKRTFGTAITNEQRRNQRKRSEGHARDPSSFFENEENISNLTNSAEFEFQINSTTTGSDEAMRKKVDKYWQFGDTRNFPLR